jgi:hypothetical protein
VVGCGEDVTLSPPSCVIVVVVVVVWQIPPSTAIRIIKSGFLSGTHYDFKSVSLPCHVSYSVTDSLVFFLVDTSKAYEIYGTTAVDGRDVPSE